MNTKINIGLLLKVADQITKHPEQFHMALWECGTTACIAGWSCRIADGKPYPEKDVQKRASQLLGLTSWMYWTDLFKEPCWPMHLRSWDLETAEARAAKAVLRIHTFLDEHAPGWRETRPELTSSTEADAAVQDARSDRVRELKEQG